MFVTVTNADQVQMQNGDRYSGKITALETNVLVLESEILGTLRLSRDQIGSISFGAQTPSVAATPAGTSTSVPKAPPVPKVSPAAGPNPQVDPNSSLSHAIAANPNIINEVRSQVLSGAGPKAAQKYDSMVSGLAAGNLNGADVRKEAASVAAQLRQLRTSGDPESGEIFDEYLAILDRFVAETKDATPPASGKPSKPAVPATTPKRPAPIDE